MKTSAQTSFRLLFERVLKNWLQPAPAQVTAWASTVNMMFLHRWLAQSPNCGRPPYPRSWPHCHARVVLWGGVIRSKLATSGPVLLPSAFTTTAHNRGAFKGEGAKIVQHVALGLRAALLGMFRPSHPGAPVSVRGAPFLPPL